MSLHHYWTLTRDGAFNQQQRKEDLAQGEKLPTVTELTKEAAPLYRELAPSERQDLNEEAQRAREAYPAILAAWTASLTPEMIREENKVRLQRRRQGKKGISTLRIKLEGEPKRPASGYMRYVTVAHADRPPLFNSWELNGAACFRQV